MDTDSAGPWTLSRRQRSSRLHLVGAHGMLVPVWARGQVGNVPDGRGAAGAAVARAGPRRGAPRCPADSQSAGCWRRPPLTPARTQVRAAILAYRHPGLLPARLERRPGDAGGDGEVYVLEQARPTRGADGAAAAHAVRVAVRGRGRGAGDVLGWDMRAEALQTLPLQVLLRPGRRPCPVAAL